MTPKYSEPGDDDPEVPCLAVGCFILFFTPVLLLYLLGRLVHLVY